MLDWIVVPAALLMLAAFVVCLATKPWFPRVSTVASGTMAAGLGIVALWAAFSALEKGVFEGAAGSKILRHSIYRAQSPVSFWGFFTFFALPGFLLVCYPLCAAVFNVVDWAQSTFRPSNPP